MANAHTIRIRTLPCPACGLTDTLEVPMDGYAAWHGGELIQDAFPELSAAQREQLITGYHEACWDALFNHEDDEDDKDPDPSEPNTTNTKGEPTA